MATATLGIHPSKTRDRGPTSSEGREAGVKKGTSLGTGGCLPKSQSILSIQIKSDKIRGKVELWKEKALIGKFVGGWPQEIDLVCWIKSTWNPKGHYDLHLGSKGFFTIIFFNQEDRDRVLEGWAIFFNRVVSKAMEGMIQSGNIGHDGRSGLDPVVFPSM